LKIINILQDIGNLTHPLSQFKSESFIRLPSEQDLELCPANSAEHEYYRRLVIIAKKYDAEFLKLCNERDRYCDNIVSLIKEQRCCRLFVEPEALFRIARVHEKFNYLFAQLRQNVSAAAIDGTAKVILDQRHHSEPYPSDSEKQALWRELDLH